MCVYVCVKERARARVRESHVQKYRIPCTKILVLIFLDLLVFPIIYVSAVFEIVICVAICERKHDGGRRSDLNSHVCVVDSGQHRLRLANHSYLVSCCCHAYLKRKGKKWCGKSAESDKTVDLETQDTFLEIVLMNMPSSRTYKSRKEIYDEQSKSTVQKQTD